MSSDDEPDEETIKFPDIDDGNHFPSYIPANRVKQLSSVQGTVEKDLSHYQLNVQNLEEIFQGGIKEQATNKRRRQQLQEKCRSINKKLAKYEKLDGTDRLTWSEAQVGFQ